MKPIARSAIDGPVRFSSGSGHRLTKTPEGLDFIGASATDLERRLRVAGHDASIRKPPLSATGGRNAPNVGSSLVRADEEFVSCFLLPEYRDRVRHAVLVGARPTENKVGLLGIGWRRRKR